jgi:hypothetical protein
MKTLIWTVVGLGVGAGIVLGATGITEGTQPTYIIPATTTTQPATPVAPVTVPLPGGNNLCRYADDCGGGRSEPGPPMDSDPTEVPCVPVNQDATGKCGTYGVIPYPPGDSRLGVPADPSPTPVPEAPFAPQDEFGPHLV